MTTLDDLRSGEIYHLGPACGIQWRIRPIYLRLIRIESTRTSWNGTAYLEGYELDEHLAAAETRTVYVIVAGLVHLDLRRRQPAAPVRRPTNRAPIPARIPRPRNSTSTTVRSTP